MNTEEKETSPFLFVGGKLWLDFVNTEKMSHGEQVDLLRSSADLAAWLAQASIAQQGRELSESEGERLLERARQLRAALRTLAGEMAQDIPLSKAVVEPINALLNLRQGSFQLVQQEDEWIQEFQSEATESELLLVSIAQSAADTISDGSGRLVHQCEGTKCILYFCDTSKNHKRRWCSMGGCGNRQKAAEHYRRTRPSKPIADRNQER